jgi:hypothetical protein
MNGYVIGGYLVVLASLGTYSLFLVQRLRAAKRRIGATVEEAGAQLADDRRELP